VDVTTTRRNPHDATQLGRRKGLATLRRYLPLLRGQLRDVALMFALMLVSTSVSLAIPVFAGRFVDSLSENLARGFSRVQLGILAGLLVVQLLGTFFYTVVSSRLGLRTITRLRRRLFGHLLELPSLFFVGQKAGDLSSRLTADVGSIQYLLTDGLISVARAAFTLLGAVVLMLRLNPKLTGVVLLLVPTTIILVQLFGRRLQKFSRTMYRELGQVSSHVQEIAGAIRVIKVYNNQRHERERFNGMLTRYLTAGVKRAWLSAALESSAQILLWICLIGVMVFGFYLSAQGETSYGELVAFLLLAFRVAIPMSSLTSLYSSAQGAVAAADRLDVVFDSEPEQRGVARSADRDPERNAERFEDGPLVFDQVGFSYGGNADSPPVIENLSFAITPGQSIGIVGPSGAGKTTLTGLLLRLFDPQSGRITLAGRPYRDYDLYELRARMAYVSQEPVLYDLSIDENIRFGLDSATPEQVRQAAASANALDFIEALPDGFATHCGDRGIRLSGGERQRITLARAFLRNPRILILDEPTSALDAQSEQTVGAALRKLMRGRTAIVIAHRLSLVRDLDFIFVLSDGKLSEQGSHDELLARGGLYSFMYRLQHGSSND